MKYINEVIADIPGQIILFATGLIALTIIYIVSYYSGYDWLILSFFLVPFILWGLFKCYQKSQYLIALTAFGTYMGSVVFLAEGSAVPITLFQVFLLFAFFVVLIRRINHSQFVLRYSGIEMELLLFLTLIFFSILYTPAPQDGFIYAIRILIIILFFFFVLNELNHERNISMIFIVMCLTCIVLAIISIRSTLLNPELAVENIISEGRRLRGRAAGTSHDPNRFATYFFIPIAFVVSIMISKARIWKRALSLAGLMILVPGILITYSRSAWVSALIMLLVIAVMYRHYRIFIYLILAGSILLIVLPDLRLTLMTIIQRFFDIIAGTSDDSSRVRLMLGIAAVHMFIDSWMMGVGIKGFVDKFNEYFSHQETIGIAEPHNVIYTVMAELGIIGLVLYLFIIGKIIFVAYKNIKRSENDLQMSINVTLFSSMIAFIVFYQFYGGGLNDNNIWMLAGMIFFMQYRQNLGNSPHVLKSDNPG
jgi:O-antigen ligase